MEIPSDDPTDVAPIKTGNDVVICDVPSYGPPLPENVLCPSNTPASDTSVVARENQGQELPHKVESIPSGAKPTPPCSGVSILGTKLRGGNLSHMEDLLTKSHEPNIASNSSSTIGQGPVTNISSSSSPIHCLDAHNDICPGSDDVFGCYCDPCNYIK